MIREGPRAARCTGGRTQTRADGHGLSTRTRSPGERATRATWSRSSCRSARRGHRAGRDGRVARRRGRRPDRGEPEVSVVTVFSKEHANTVVAPGPTAGRRSTRARTCGSTSRRARSRSRPGRRRPAVRQRASDAPGAGFSVVERHDVDSSQPKAPSSPRSRRRHHGRAQGATVTLNVSKGPKTTTVPNVESQDEASRRRRSRVGLQRRRAGAGHDRPGAQDGIVISQDPARRHEGEARVDRDDRRRPATRPPPTTTVRPDDDRAGRDRAASRVAVHAAAARASTRSRSPRRVRCSSRSTRLATRPSRSRSAATDAGSWLGIAGELAQDGRSARRRCPSRRAARRRRSPTSTSSSRCCTGRSARTAPFRACSSSPAFPTSARACSARRSRMDKDLFKAVMRDSGIPVAQNVALREGDELGTRSAIPVFVKPARLGSSVGISKVRDEAELAPAVELAFRHDEKVLVEEFVDGHRGRVRRARQPRARLRRSRARSSRTRDWYDYSSKYDEGGMDLVVPPRVRRRRSSACRARGRRLRRDRVRGHGPGRLLRPRRRRGVVNELNTIPGFTATSVYAKLFEASGIPYAELLDRLVELALERHERRAQPRVLARHHVMWSLAARAEPRDPDHVVAVAPAVRVTVKVVGRPSAATPRRRGADVGESPALISAVKPGVSVCRPSASSSATGAAPRGRGRRPALSKLGSARSSRTLPGRRRSPGRLVVLGPVAAGRTRRRRGGEPAGVPPRRRAPPSPIVEAQARAAPRRTARRRGRAARADRDRQRALRRAAARGRRARRDDHRRALPSRRRAPRGRPRARARIAHRLEPVAGSFAIARWIAAVEPRAARRAAARDARRRLVHVPHRDRDEVVALERRLARQQLVEHDAERVDVRQRVDLLAARLLGRDVVARAEHRPGLRHPCDVERARDPEVGHLRLPVAVEQDVLRLHVAVHEPAGVRERERARDLDASPSASPTGSGPRCRRAPSGSRRRRTRRR